MRQSFFAAPHYLQRVQQQQHMKWNQKYLFWRPVVYLLSPTHCACPFSLSHFLIFRILNSDKILFEQWCLLSVHFAFIFLLPLCCAIFPHQTSHTWNCTFKRWCKSHKHTIYHQSCPSSYLIHAKKKKTKQNIPGFIHVYVALKSLYFLWWYSRFYLYNCCLHRPLWWMCEQYMSNVGDCGPCKSHQTLYKRRRARLRNGITVWA